MMTDIGATIRKIYNTAEGDRVQAVQDYLSDKADILVSRQYAENMIWLHVINYQLKQAITSECEQCVTEPTD